ncbi:MAG: hypothetical protein JXR70_19740 [Spirochaetales bacterium]|nr:hypothetical protein [Spirochaetales bacterium]
MKRKCLKLLMILFFVLIILTGCDFAQKIYYGIFPTSPPNDQPTPVVLEPVKYEVTVHTADVLYAGTNADVFITIYGSEGQSEKFQLDKPGYNDFERNNTDLYSVTTPDDLGNLSHVRIEHNDKGMASGWKLDYVNVRNTKTDMAWFFQCKRWLAKDEEDGKIQRTITLESCK